jgi:uncharacterized delta-60 repeat protein
MKRYTIITAIFFICVSALFLPAKGQAVQAPLDPAFGNGGRVINQFISPPYHFSSSVRDIAVQPDGKIVIVGTLGFVQSHIIVIRYNPDGSRDASFGNGNGEASIGFVEGEAYASGIAIQPDGRIVVAGGITRPTSPSQEFVVLRFGTSGGYDTSFGSGGVARIDIGLNPWRADVAVQPDGKIVIAGAFNDGSSLVRLNPTGSLDTSFDGDGRVACPGSVSSLVLQQDGKIIVAGTDGSHSMLARFNLNGSPDLTFAGDGVVTTVVGSDGCRFTAVALQPDGKIVALGSAFGYDLMKELTWATLVRYHPTGALDESFDGDGLARFYDWPLYVWGEFSSLAIRSNGQIVTSGGGGVFGSMGSSYLGRISANGSVDGVSIYGFGNRSGLSTVALQPDGKIVAGGARYAGQYGTSTDITVARFLPDVSVSGRVTTPGGQALRNATVVLTDAQNNTRTAVTSSFGNYTFENVIQGQKYTLTARSKRYRFAPRLVSVTDNMTGVDLIGSE